MVLEGSAASHAVLGRLRFCWFQMPPGAEGPRLRAARCPGLGLLWPCGGRGAADPQRASAGGLPGPTHRTAAGSCSPPGNKGTSPTRSGCRVGPAGTDTAVASQRPSPAPACPLGAHLVLFSPMGSDCDCPLPAQGAHVRRLPGRRDLLPRAGSGLAPLLGHRQSGAVAHVAALHGSRGAAGGWTRRQ